MTGGQIFIDVPNVKQYSSVGGMGCFFHQHISYFSIGSLTTLLNKYGFEIESFHEGSPNLFVYARKVDGPREDKTPENMNGELMLDIDSKKEALRRSTRQGNCQCI